MANNKKPKKGGDNLHVETKNFAALAGMGQGNVRGDRAITFDNIETTASDNTYVNKLQFPFKKYGTEEKSPNKMMGMPSVLKMCGSKRHMGKKK